MAWAAVQDDRVLVDTVSSTNRSAMIKWMALHGGYNVPDGMGEFATREHFEKLSLGRVKVARVQVNVPGERRVTFNTVAFEQNRMEITPYEDIGAAEAAYHQILGREYTVAVFLYSSRDGLLDYWSKPN
jgi:hypothetical protein